MLPLTSITNFVSDEESSSIKMKEPTVIDDAFDTTIVSTSAFTTVEVSVLGLEVALAGIAGNGCEYCKIGE